MPKKETQRKKAERFTMASNGRMIQQVIGELSKLSASVRTLKAYEAMQEALAEHAAAPQPAEPWVPKVGDWVVSDKHNTVILASGRPYKVSRVDEDWLEVDTGEYGNMAYGRLNFRPATPAEIAAYHQEQAEEAERAKPLKFGTRVKYGGAEGYYINADGPEPIDYHRIAFVRDNGKGEVAIVKRHDFTVISDKP